MYNVRDHHQYTSTHFHMYIVHYKKLLITTGRTYKCSRRRRRSREKIWYLLNGLIYYLKSDLIDAAAAAAADRWLIWFYIVPSPSASLSLFRSQFFCFVAFFIAQLLSLSIAFSHFNISRVLSFNFFISIFRTIPFFQPPHHNSKPMYWQKLPRNVRRLCKWCSTYVHVSFSFAL